jgi:hypothetical protein
MAKLLDPSANEMREYLKLPKFKIYEFTEFDIEGAIYWYASNYHSGQDSELYSALSTSDYTPGCTESGPNDDTMGMAYEELEANFGKEE